jgi:iron complex outermembrane recepter protein
LRGTKGTSFRAPALFEQFQGATSGFLSAANDPCNDYGTSGVSQTVVDNCSSELPGQPDFQNTSGVEVFSVGGADAGLKAETSDNITYGIVIKPAFDDINLTIEVDYFDIQIDNSITQAGATEILDRCYSSPSFATDQGFCRLVSRDPVSAQLSVSDAYINLATQNARGLDLTLLYEQGIGPGSLSADASFTRYYEQSEKLFPEDDLTDYNGNIEQPEFNADIFLAYTLHHWRLAYGITWIGSMDSYNYLEEVEGESIYDYNVPSYLEHRTSLSYQATNWKATFGIRNLTNEIPPSISFGYYNRVGNAPLYSGYDYVGREAFLNVQILLN